MKRVSGLLLLLIAYGMLLPGLTQPLLTLTGTVEKSDLVAIGKDIIVESPDTPELLDAMAEVIISNMDVTGELEVYQKTRSIIGTIRELHSNGYTIVAALIGLFSVVVPAVKGLMLLFSFFKIPQSISSRLKALSSMMSKWSMADVFVIGVFVAFLAANAIKREGGILSFEAILGSGFYFFLGYCLLSILSSQILSSNQSRES
ncbi:MAG: paraquat-inducible protein A [Acidiferrobacterales bacterium]|nr:paraquat-inducible protein A [Acidiferrobacterales bacterium]